MSMFLYFGCDYFIIYVLYADSVILYISIALNITFPLKWELKSWMTVVTFVCLPQTYQAKINIWFNTQSPLQHSIFIISPNVFPTCLSCREKISKSGWYGHYLCKYLCLNISLETVLCDFEPFLYFPGSRLWSMF